VDVRVLTWNLYHGRDGPPDPTLFTKRAEWTRRTERNETHVQVNRNLYPEFSRMLAAASWDVALLQECPPRWVHGLARDCRAESYRSLTSRNWLLPLTSIIARRNPDLVGAAEGGSNTILARGDAGGISEHHTFTMRWVRPERRTMAFARLGCGLCVTSLHASTNPRLAEPELIRAADRAVEWSMGSPLVLGGDFNVRPAQSDVFALLAERHGLRGSTAPDAIDHLLTLGVELLEGPQAWPPGKRELEEDGLALTLSDHAPVEALLRIA
jgi:endonuclease/exonuclease/phosphatase family metal-dependent hydrolase